MCIRLRLPSTTASRSISSALSIRSPTKPERQQKLWNAVVTKTLALVMTLGLINPQENELGAWPTKRLGQKLVLFLYDDAKEKCTRIKSKSHLLQKRYVDTQRTNTKIRDTMMIIDTDRRWDDSGWSNSVPDESCKRRERHQHQTAIVHYVMWWPRCCHR